MAFMPSFMPFSLQKIESKDRGSLKGTEVTGLKDSKNRKNRKNDLTLILLLAAVLFVSNIWGYDLWAPDEPTFAEIAREMIEEGNWVLPHNNGWIYTDKPPFFFWLISLFSLLLGEVSSFSARIPSVLAGIGTIYLAYLLALRSLGRKTAFLSCLVLSTTFLFFDKARSAQTDMVLTFFIVLSFFFFFMARSESLFRKRYVILFYLVLALATLTKGPVGFLIPLGVVLLYLASVGEIKKSKELFLWEGILLFLFVVVGWIAAATVVGKGEYNIWATLNRHVLNRFAEGLHHHRPFYYFLSTFPIDFLPWTLFFPAAFALAFKRLRSVERKEVAFYLCWFFFVFIFFSFSQEKRNLYLLPLFPAASIMVGHLLKSVIAGEDEDVPQRFSSMINYFLSGFILVSGFFLPVIVFMKARDHFFASIILGSVIILSAIAIFVLTFKRGWFLGISFAYFPFFFTLGLSLPILSIIKNMDFFMPVFFMGIILVIGSIILFIENLRKNSFKIFLVLTLTISTFYLTTVLFAYPILDNYKSARNFSLMVSKEVKPYLKEGERLPTYKLYRSSYVFYSGLYLELIPSEVELKALLDQEKRTFCLITEDYLNDILSRSDLPIYRIQSEKIGHRSMVLISNQL
jgi:4-amino-4-deoxy-L-arabinose transferase-like glycosyltransferase